MRTNELAPTRGNGSIQTRGGSALVLLAGGEDSGPVTLALQGTGMRLEVVPGPAAAIESLAGTAHDLVLVDLAAGGGGALLAQLRDLDPTVPILALGVREGGLGPVEVREAGASAFVPRPWGDLQHELSAAIDLLRLLREVEGLRRSPPVHPGPEPTSLAGRQTLNDLRTAALRDPEPVLLTGEVGAGHRQAGLRLHQASPRASGPYLVLPAGALAPEAALRELLGSGAPESRRRGLLELASGGTLLIDGVERLPEAAQGALISVVEGRPYRRPGDERWVQVDVRIVAATSRRIGDLIRDQRVREDLVRRLAVTEVALPSLRDRTQDIAALARGELARVAMEHGWPELALSAGAEELLARSDWPGNVAQLAATLVRAAIAAGGGLIDARHLPVDIRAAPQADEASLDSAVRRRVLDIYERNNGNITRTAAQLGISRVALRRKLRRYGVIPPAAKDMAAGGEA